MKKLLLLLALLPFTLRGAEYYVSTTGNDSWPGTLAQPFRTWNRGFNALSPGDILNIRSGIYYDPSPTVGGTAQMVRVSGKNGSAGNKYTVRKYPSDATKPILHGRDMSGNVRRYGIDFEGCSYWELTDLVICHIRGTVGALHTGIVNHNSHHLTFERCEVHHIEGAGFGQSDGGNGNMYINCDAHHCADAINRYEHGDGFIFGLNTDHSVVVTCRGCRSWHNSDDGFDTFNNEGVVIWQNCWTWGNGQYGLDGDGNGFKFGKTTTASNETARRIARFCISAGNVQHGYAKSESTGINYLYNCVAYNNVVGIAFGSAEGGANVANRIRNCISYLNIYDYFFWTNCIVDHNSWNMIMSAGDIVSMDTSQLSRPRQANGELPFVTFFMPSEGSRLIDAGIDVGLPYYGSAPDVGAFEIGLVVVPEEPPEPPGPIGPLPKGVLIMGNKFVIRDNKWVIIK